METRCVTIAFTLAWRSLASRPARSFTAALGIAVSIATVLSVQVVDRNTIVTLRRLAPARRVCEDGKWIEVEGGAAGAARSFRVVGLLANGGLGAARRIVVPFESGAALYSDAPILPLWLGRLAPHATSDDLA